MKVKLYCVYDKRAKEGYPVFQSPNDLVAIRSTMSMFKSGEMPADMRDYSLYCLGEYDTEIALIVTDCQMLVCECSEYENILEKARS